eukprot:3932876-Rhodomonas_salina.1
MWVTAGIRVRARGSGSEFGPRGGGLMEGGGGIGQCRALRRGREGTTESAVPRERIRHRLSEVVGRSAPGPVRSLRSGHRRNRRSCERQPASSKTRIATLSLAVEKGVYVNSFQHCDELPPSFDMPGAAGNGQRGLQKWEHCLQK